MPEARRRRVQVLFEAAFERSPEEQASFLDHACADDVDLRREVENILMAARATTDLRLRNLAAEVRADHEAATVLEPPSRHTLDGMEERAALPAPGATIQQYELIRRLGSGGMGDVYLARDLKLARRVAIKFLQQPDRSLSKRFLLEAQATARCTHENIVIIHDVNEHCDLPFMVLEYLKGQSFSELIGGDRLPPGRAVQLIVPVVRALECAHRHKIVHRDLKPANIFMTDTGTIKVLDFGIAKLMHGQSLSESGDGVATFEGMSSMELRRRAELTARGTLVGTLPYMSPEQWGADSIDHRTDLWAVGILLYHMVVGRHPLSPLEGERLMVTAVLEQPMPSAHNSGVDMPLELADIIDHCLRKRKEERIPSAKKLLAALEMLLPGHRPTELRAGDSPYAGLHAFQESDATRFFGRSHEIGTIMAQLHGAPIIGIVGPSGVGKSSFVRAGLIPALKHSGELWETMIIRPGRHPMGALANIVVPMVTTAASSLTDQVAEHQTALQRLYDEPGYLGTLLRSRARTSGRKILLFVDQFEELYTLIRDTDERRAFTACLTGMADDALSPLRLVLSLRSDFIDRLAEDRQFLGEIRQHLVFLGAPDRTGLREAIVRPAEMFRYRFETSDMVENMLDMLQATPGCLPLLQFAATKLWEARDTERRLLTEHSYRRLGGVVGALATHADAVMAALPLRSQALARAILLQLVTPERTRAIASVVELCELSDAQDEVERVIDQLVDARLLVVQGSSRGEGATVEIIHEALIHGWPSLAHWLDENQEDAVFLEQLRTAAKQWEARGRSTDLLWRGETMHEAQDWYRRYRGTLPPLQEHYLRAVFAWADRANRIKRAMVAGTMMFLLLLVVAGGVALVSIRNAEQQAREQASAARNAEQLAHEKTAEIQRQLKVIQEKEAARQAAVVIAQSSQERAERSEEERALTNEELKRALKQQAQALEEARAARTKAEDSAAAAERANQRLTTALVEVQDAKKETERLLAEERMRNQRRHDQLGDRFRRGELEKHGEPEKPEELKKPDEFGSEN